MKQILLFIVIIVLLAGCASCNKTNSVDTNKNKIILKKPVEPGLSTGTILLKATLLEEKTSGNFNTLKLKVNKVLDYGHSTPTLANGEMLNVIVKNDKLKNRLSKDKSVNILLKHSPQKVGTATSAEWILINIK